MTNEQIIKLLIKLNIVEKNWDRYFVNNKLICSSMYPNLLLQDGRVVVATIQKLLELKEKLPSRYQRKFINWFPISMFKDPQQVIEACCEELEKLT